MFRKLVCCLFVVFMISGALYAQHGKAKDLSGEYFGEEAYLRPMKLVAGTAAPEINFTRYPDIDCPEGTLNVICFAIDDPNVITTQNLNNVTHIVIPGKSLRDVLLIEARNFYWLYYQTDLGSADNAFFLHQPTITIKSPALATPITANVGHRRIVHWLTPDESFGGMAADEMQYGRTYRLTRSLMIEAMGMSKAQVDQFFDNDITIELNLQVRVKHVDYSDSLYDLMIYGY